MIGVFQRRQLFVHPIQYWFVWTTLIYVACLLIMLYASGPISDFVNQHPTIKMLALSFLLLIGFTLVVAGLGLEIPKGYIYFAMGFSVFVEMLNLRMRKKRAVKAAPVHLHSPYAAEGESGKS